MQMAKVTGQGSDKLSLLKVGFNSIKIIFAVVELLNSWKN